MFTFSIKHETRHFASYSSCKTVKKCTKKRDARAKLLFCSLCLLFFYLLDGVASLNLEVSNLFVKGQNKVLFRACLHGGKGPQVGEVKYGGSPHQSCKRDQIKMRDYMDKRVTPPKRVTSPTWGPPPRCKQALSEDNDRSRR